MVTTLFMMDTTPHVLVSNCCFRNCKSSINSKIQQYFDKI